MEIEAILAFFLTFAVAVSARVVNGNAGMPPSIQFSGSILTSMDGSFRSGEQPLFH